MYSHYLLVAHLEEKVEEELSVKGNWTNELKTYFLLVHKVPFNFLQSNWTGNYSCNVQLKGNAESQYNYVNSIICWCKLKMVYMQM